MNPTTAKRLWFVVSILVIVTVVAAVIYLSGGFSLTSTSIAF